eukprot:2900052-Prymnesium_polylepis.1
MLQRLTKSILWLDATLVFTLWSRSSLWTRSWAKVNKSHRGAGSPPSSWDLDGGWGGARHHEALIRQSRAHDQIHCNYQS